MAMDAGNAACTAGLAKRIYDNWVGDVRNGFAPVPSMAQLDNVKALVFAVASAVVAEIQANATVTIKTSDAGLQRDTTAGNPSTLGPSASRTLPGGAVQ